MCCFRNGTTWIVFPEQKPFHLCELKSAEAVEYWTNDGVFFGAELALGKYRVKVENFKHALAIWQAIRAACKRGDEFFRLQDWKWDGK